MPSTWYTKAQTDTLLGGKASLAGIRATSARLSTSLRSANSHAFSSVASDAPTYTISTSRSLTGQRYTGPQTGEVTELGSRGTWNAGSSRLQASGLTGLGFYITGDRVEIGMIPGIGGPIPTWIFVDDVPVTLTPTSRPSPPPPPVPVTSRSSCSAAPSAARLSTTPATPATGSTSPSPGPRPSNRSSAPR